MNRCILLISLLMIGYLAVAGQERCVEARIGFHVASDSIDLSFKDNADGLSEIISRLGEITSDSMGRLTMVIFTGFTSLEGRFAYNRRLAAARTSAIEKYIRSQVELPDSIVSSKPGGMAWDVLAGEVAASDMPHKEEALRVLRDVPEYVYDNRGRLIDSRKKHLMELRGGRTWRYMYKHFFAPMRYAGIIVLTEEPAPEPPLPEIETPDRETTITLVDTVAPPPPAEVDTVEATPSVAPPARNPFFMSAKTNMLYDILLLPNAGIEFHLGSNWSITANWMYGWWDNQQRCHYWRAYGGDIAVRKWFGKAAAGKPLTGHHVGVYGQALLYDIAFNGKGQMGSAPGKSMWESPSYAAGLEYGYSLPLSRKLNIDFTIGIGYLGGKYYEYETIDYHYVWLTTKQRHWFGPTKAEISLVWLIGHSNYNKTRGGTR